MKPRTESAILRRIMLTPETARRLAFIRLLVARAEEESRQPPPFSYASINRFHDAAEMFLALAVQQHNLAIPKDILEYWNAFQPILGRPLGYKAQVQKFNKVRVSLKHYGAEPAPAEVEHARTTVMALLSDECPALFGVALDEVSLTAFVAPADARRLLDSAQRNWNAGNAEAAFADLADSFEKLVSDYEQRKMLGHATSIFDSTEDMTFLKPVFRRVESRKQSKFEDAVIKSLQALDFSVMLVGFGVDFRRYGKFRALTPIIVRMMNGQRHSYDRPGTLTRTQAEFDFCRDFVVTTAIHLAEFDYDLDWQAAYRALRSTKKTV
jgi:hypothetical protein